MQTLNLRISGLYTNPNIFSEIPPGALKRADEIVIDRESVAESRRGQAEYGDISGVADKMFDYQGYLLAHYGSTMSYDSDQAGTFSDYSGNFDPPSSAIRIRSVEANQNLYVTTNEGVKKLDEIGGSWVAAGAPKGLGGTLSLTNSGGGFMSTNRQVAYRIVWGYEDANDNEIVGAPSQRLVIANDTGETQDVSQTWQIPAEVTSNYFYRVYRSGQSASASSVPDDELQQVKEGKPTSGELTAGEFSFTDIVPDSLRGASLYTNPSQQGLQAQNEPPPLCVDLCLFKDFAFFFNTTSKNRYFSTLIAVGDNTLGGSFGFQTNAGDLTNTSTTIDGLSKAATIDIQDLNYTADTAGVAGNDINVEYVDSATAGNELINVDGNSISVDIEGGVSTADQIKAAIDAGAATASLVVQDLTYTSDAAGYDGNSISISYIDGAVAGSEVVNVDGNAIEVEIEDGVSTANQIKTAVDANSAAAALVNVSVTGTGTNAQSAAAPTNLASGSDDATGLVDVVVSGIGANAQTIQAITFLNDGFDTSFLNIGMRVVGTGIVSGSLIESITDIDTIEIDTAATSTSTESLEFQDRISIDTMNYWAASSADYPNRQFEAVLSGTAASNIENTALNLVQAINEDPNNTLVYAYYQSSNNDVPGMILLEERGLGASSFAVTSTNGESFSPVLEATGVNNISDADARQNRAMISKQNQPEAVPVFQSINIGSENYPITRAIANRDSIFVFKDGEGIFRISGTDISNFNVSSFDSSAKIKAPESAVLLNNLVYTFSDKGIIEVGETGVRIVSRPIESTLLKLSSPSFTNFESQTFGVSYETDHKYIFYTVTTETDTYATQAFVYNAITNTWTRWLMTRSCGLVLKRDNKLYMGVPNNSGNKIYQERKNFNRTDYADEDIPITIVLADGTTLAVLDNSQVEAGDLIKQGALEALVVSTSGTLVVVVDRDEPWSGGAATLYKAIAPDLEWVPDTASNPGVLKHFSECTILFQDANFSSIEVGFQSSFLDTYQIVNLGSIGGSGWGQFAWGERPWGTGGGRPGEIRTLVPVEYSRCSWLNFKVRNREAFSSFSLAGISAQFNPMSSRFR